MIDTTIITECGHMYCSEECWGSYVNYSPDKIKYGHVAEVEVEVVAGDDTTSPTPLALQVVQRHEAVR